MILQKKTKFDYNYNRYDHEFVYVDFMQFNEINEKTKTRINQSSFVDDASCELIIIKMFVQIMSQNRKKSQKKFKIISYRKKKHQIKK